MNTYQVYFSGSHIVEAKDAYEARDIVHDILTQNVFDYQIEEVEGLWN